MHLRRFSILFVAGCLVSGPISAQTAPTRLYENGQWNVTRSVSNRGRPICAITVQVLGLSNAFVVMKYVAGETFIMAQVFKESWRIPAGVRANLTMTVDRANLGTFDAENLDGIGLAWSFALDQWRTTIANVLTNGLTARVIFQNGNEPECQISLTGSSAALTAFYVCAAGIGGNIAPGSAQPF